MGRPIVATATALTALVLAACSGGTPEAGGASEASEASEQGAASAAGTGGECSPTTAEVTNASAAGEDVPFPWDDPDAVSLPEFDPQEIRRGGPPPDGITPIDEPCVESIDAADEWLVDEESVMVVEVGEEARAYPLAIMTQHEIVNDQIADEPVVVTYCPLCNSGLAFERTLGGEVWDFGTSGRLLRSNLVMYDRQTRTLWSQFTGSAIWGDQDVLGAELERLPTQVLAWATFRDSFPDGTVLSRDSFPTRTYGRNLYPGYEDDPSSFLYRGPTDDRLDPDERIVGLGEESDAVAVPLAALEEQEAITVELEDGPATVVWAPGQASALDTEDVAGGRDVGQTGAFRVDGLEPQGDGRFLDPDTGAVHDLTGATVEGDAPDLESVTLDDTFWFVWFAFRPSTEIVTT